MSMSTTPRLSQASLEEELRLGRAIHDALWELRRGSINHREEYQRRESRLVYARLHESALAVGLITENPLRTPWQIYQEAAGLHDRLWDRHRKDPKDERVMPLVKLAGARERRRAKVYAERLKR